MSGVADEDTGDETVGISHRAASQDGKYDGIPVASVAVAVADTTPEPEPREQEPPQEPDPQEQQQAVEPPCPMQNLRLSVKNGRIVVTWDAPASGGAVTGYQVTLQDSEGGEGGEAKVRRPGPKKQKIVFRNLESGATYEVSVLAKNDAGKGEATSARITLPTADSQE